MITAEQASTWQLADYDLVIFGMNDRLMPTTASDDQLNILLSGDKDRSAKKAERAGVIVTRNPYNSERHAAWFFSDGQEYTVSVARRIPHYGRYGQLLFSAGNNQVKLSGSSPKSPLVIDFTHGNQAD